MVHERFKKYAAKTRRTSKSFVTGSRKAHKFAKTADHHVQRTANAIDRM